MERKSNISGIFDEFGNLTAKAMQDYLAGKLSAEEKSVFEKHIEGSDFEREALEGMRNMSPANFSKSIEKIHQRMDGVIQKRKYPRGKRIYLSIYTVGMAASVILLAGIVYLLSTMNTGEEHSLVQAEKEAVAIESRKEDGKGSEAQGLRGSEAQELRSSEKEEGRAVGGVEDQPEKKTYELVEVVEDEVAEDAVISPVEMIEDDIVVTMHEEEEKAVIVMEYQAPVEEYELESVEEISGVVAGASKSKNSRARSSSMAVQSADEENFDIISDEDKKYERDAFMVEDEEENEHAVFTVVEQMPEYPGGDSAMIKFLAANLRYPDSAKNNGVEGRVFINFVVEKDGTVNDARVLRGIGYGCDEEALRVIRAMPKWNPGFMRGKEVRVSYNLPIMFKL